MKTQRFRRTRRVLNWFLPLSEAGSTFTDARDRVGVIGRSWRLVFRRLGEAIRLYATGPGRYVMPNEELRRELLHAARTAWCSGVLLLTAVVVASWLWSLLFAHPVWWQVVCCALAFAGLAMQAVLIVCTAAAEARSLIRGETIFIADVLRHPAWWQPWGGER